MKWTRTGRRKADGRERLGLSVAGRGVNEVGQELGMGNSTALTIILTESEVGLFYEGVAQGSFAQVQGW